MKNVKFNVKGKKIHFIGIGGISMSALAKYCIDCKAIVSGSEKEENEEYNLLKSLGARVYLGHSVIDMGFPDIVVYTSAIGESNPELVFAMEKHITIYKRSEFLGAISKQHKKTIAVCGCHGKTTCTSMIAHVLKEVKVQPTVFIGGEDIELGNYCLGNKDFCLLEACEYKRNFLDIKPSITVVLNIDKDHPDSYDGISETINVFNKFIQGSIALINADDSNSEQLFNGTTISFGIKNNAVYRARELRENNGYYSFNVYRYGVKVIRLTLKVKGIHNIYNALSAYAVNDILGFSSRDIKRGIEGFCGVKRRGENVGDIFGITSICDYAHHPKEIKAFLSTFNGYNEDTLVVFQPHTYSRTIAFFDEFIEALFNCKNIVLYKTYGAREEYTYNGSHKALFNTLKERGLNTFCAENESELQTIIEQNKKAIKSLLFVGAGDIYYIAKKLVKKCRKFK